MHTIRRFVLSGVALLLGARALPASDTLATLRWAGCSHEGIERLRALHVTEDEAPDVARMLYAGLSESVALRVVELDRQRTPAFTAGAAVANLKYSGIEDATIVGLCSIGSVPAFVADATRLKYSGLDDESILFLARLRFVAKRRLLPGADLARLKYAGFSDASIDTLAAHDLRTSGLDSACNAMWKGQDENAIVRRLAGGD